MVALVNRLASILEMLRGMMDAGLKNAEDRHHDDPRRDDGCFADYDDKLLLHFQGVPIFTEEALNVNEAAVGATDNEFHLGRGSGDGVAVRWNFCLLMSFADNPGQTFWLCHAVWLCRRCHSAEGTCGHLEFLVIKIGRLRLQEKIWYNSPVYFDSASAPFLVCAGTVAF